MTIGRSIGGVVAGIVVAGVVIAVVEAIGHAALSADRAFVAAVVGYGLGAAAGTGVAAVIATTRVAMIVPAILAVLAIVNVMSFPHPRWFVPAAVAALMLGAVAGAQLRRLAGGRHR